MINVIIADDQVLLRNSLSKIISTNNEINVIKTVGTGEECVDAAFELNPDVILMDIEMPNIDGISALKIVKNNDPKTKVIMLTTFDDSEKIMDSFSVGADGFLLKDVECDELVATIKCVHNGLCVIHNNVKNLMVSRFNKIGSKKRKENLEDEELLIIKLIVDGKSNKDIAEILNYTEGTIKNKVSKIYEKLEINDRLKLAIYAVENGIK